MRYYLNWLLILLIVTIYYKNGEHEQFEDVDSVNTVGSCIELKTIRVINYTYGDTIEVRKVTWLHYFDVNKISTVRIDSSFNKKKYYKYFIQGE